MRTKMHKLSKVLILTILVGCKPTSSGSKADNKSIDALTQADQSARNNMFCGDAKAPNETAKDAVKRVYAALPVGLKQILDTQNELKNEFGTSGNDYAGIENITMMSSVTHMCKNILKEQKQKANVKGDLRLEAIKGCWRGRQVGQKALPEIFIKEDIQAIHNGLIPMAVYGVVELYFDRILGEYLAKLGKNTKGALSKSEEFLLSFYERFNEARSELAKSLVADLTSQKMNDTLASYKEMYGANFEQSIEFRNFVLAELMDSHYCSEASRKTFDKSTFPQSKASFEKIIAIFGPSPLWPTVKVSEVAEVPPDLTEEVPATQESTEKPEEEETPAEG